MIKIFSSTQMPISGAIYTNAHNLLDELIANYPKLKDKIDAVNVGDGEIYTIYSQHEAPFGSDINADDYASRYGLKAILFTKDILWSPGDPI